MISVNSASFIPLYEQVKKEIRRLITLGGLKPHEALPSIRDLAADLVVNPNTVARAYRELEHDGFIYTQKGRGCFVADRNPSRVTKAKDAYLNQVFDQAIEEARRFDLSPSEILGLFERRLGGKEDKSGK